MKQRPINLNNFLRFEPTASTSNVLDTEYGLGLHSGNRLWRRKVLAPIPLMVGETYTFYTNFDAPTFDPADIVLVYDSNCNYTEITDVNEPSVTASTWGTNNLKITLTCPSTTTSYKFVRLAVKTAPDTFSHVSNIFKTIEDDIDGINNTHLFKFYHNTNIYNYEWAGYDPTTDTPYTIRIPSTNKGVEYPREVSTYESATSGRSRNTRAINRKDNNFQIYFADDYNHDAVATIINFRYLEINQKEFLPLESYEVEYNDEFNIYSGNLKVRDVAYSVRISGCTV
jgi:hypothetical protein